MTYREAMESASRAYLYRLLSDTGGNMTKAARIAGLHRCSLYRTLRQLGIKVEHRRYVKLHEVAPQPPRPSAAATQGP